MLLAVEGGGFFSSSASGYSKGLTLLLLGQKDEDKRVRVSPWNQYHLVDQEPETGLQLASRKKWLSKVWVSFVCFGCASPGIKPPSQLKVGGSQTQEIWSGHLVSDKCEDHKDDLQDCDIQRVAPKSNLKRRTSAVAIPVVNASEREALVENMNDIQVLDVGRRKVQWTDAAGTELVEIREFEPSEMGGSDDELDSKNERSCSCTIM